MGEVTWSNTVCDRDRHNPEGMGGRMWLLLPAQPLAPADGHRKAAAQEIASHMNQGSRKMLKQSGLEFFYS